MDLNTQRVEYHLVHDGEFTTAGSVVLIAIQYPFTLSSMTMTLFFLRRLSFSSTASWSSQLNIWRSHFATLRRQLPILGHSYNRRVTPCHLQCIFTLISTIVTEATQSSKPTAITHHGGTGIVVSTEQQPATRSHHVDKVAPTRNATSDEG